MSLAALAETTPMQLITLRLWPTSKYSLEAKITFNDEPAKERPRLKLAARSKPVADNAWAERDMGAGSGQWSTLSVSVRVLRLARVIRLPHKLVCVSLCRPIAKRSGAPTARAHLRMTTRPFYASAAPMPPQHRLRRQRQRKMLAPHRPLRTRSSQRRRPSRKARRCRAPMALHP